MSYTPVDSMIHELEEYTGRLLEPEKIHELDLRAIYQTTIQEVKSTWDEINESTCELEEEKEERDIAENHLRVALEVLRDLVEIDRTKKGRSALLAFQKASHEARRVLEENWA